MYIIGKVNLIQCLCCYKWSSPIIVWGHTYIFRKIAIFFVQLTFTQLLFTTSLGALIETFFLNIFDVYKFRIEAVFNMVKRVYMIFVLVRRRKPSKNK